MSHQQEVYALFLIIANVYLAGSLPRGPNAVLGCAWMLIATAINAGWVSLK